MSLDQTLTEIKQGIDSVHSRVTEVQVQMGKFETTLDERVPKNLLQTLQSLKDSQRLGCESLRKHEEGHKKAWWAVTLAFIVASLSLFKDSLARLVGLK